MTATVHSLAEYRERKRVLVAHMGRAQAEDVCPGCGGAVQPRSLVASEGRGMPTYHAPCFWRRFMPRED